MEILINLALGVSGLLLYSLFKARKYFNVSFSIVKFWSGAKWTWLWVFLMLMMISIIIEYVPEASDSIKALTGLDIGFSKASFITLGMGLTGLTAEAKK